MGSDKAQEITTNANDFNFLDAFLRFQVITLDLQRHLIAHGVIHGGLGDFGIRADGRRDDDGIDGPRTREALAAFRRMRGGSAGTDELRASVHRDQPGMGLARRALAYALREWCDGVREEPDGSNTGPRIREYLNPCQRRADGRYLGLTSGAWCAAAASWCAFRAIRSPADVAPHGYRASGIELQRDLESGDYPGRWLPIEAVRAGLEHPRPGDLVILSRAGTWTRHVCRLVAWQGDVIWTIGGNEGNQWRLTPRRIGDPKLLGFGAYPDDPTENERIEELCPGTAARGVCEAVCE